MAECSMCHREVFNYKVRSGKNVCRDCQGSGIHHRKVSTFPFTTTHMSPDGSSVTVNSIAHLRRLESQYGVQSHAYNSDRPERDYVQDAGEMIGVSPKGRR